MGDCFVKGRSYRTMPFGNTWGLTSYLVVIALFLWVVIGKQRNYNDPWILDGILIPTLTFVFIFFMVQSFVKGNRKIAVVTSLFLVALYLIPGLKYQLFYNPYDSTFHFRFASELLLFGNVASVRVAGTPGATEYYIGDPGMHILISSLSTVSGIPINDIFRFVIPATFGLIPLIVFFLTRNVLSETVQKYAIVASAFPVAQGYIVTGTNLSMVVYFLLFAVFLRVLLSDKNRRQYVAIFIILGFTLIVSHPVTPVFAALLLVGMPIGLRILRMLRPLRFPKFKASQPALLVPLYLAMLIFWWATMATANLVFFAKYIESVFSLTAFMVKPPVPTRFFEVPLWAQLRIFFVFNIHYAIMGVLSLLGLLYFLRSLRKKELDDKTKRFYTYFLVFIGIIAMYLLFMTGYGYAPLAYQRFMAYALPFCIFLVGLFLFRLNVFLSKIFPRIEVRNLVFALLLSMLFSFSLLQFFPSQPLVPRASVLGKDFSENDYLVDVQLINTVYQKLMISFVEKHSSEAKMVSDIATGWQIYGFSNGSLYKREMRYDPLEPVSKQNPISDWNLFLLHTRKAGPFQEQVEYRTESKINDLRTDGGNLVYDNGESFIISRVNELTPIP